MLLHSLGIRFALGNEVCLHLSTPNVSFPLVLISVFVMQILPNCKGLFLILGEYMTVKGISIISRSYQSYLYLTCKNSLSFQFPLEEILLISKDWNRRNGQSPLKLFWLGTQVYSTLHKLTLKYLSLMLLNFGFMMQV